MWFKALYFLYLIVAFLFPSTSLVGSVSIRHIVMVVMLVSCIVKGIHWDKNMTFYTIFMVFFALSSFFTGFANIFISKFLGTYLQVYVMFFATYTLIKKYDGADWLYWFFIVFGLSNALVTIGQYFHLGFAERIVEVIGTNYDEDFIRRMERYDIMEGVAVQGLVDSVRNGYFLSATAVLALYNKNGKISLINLITWLFVMAASLLAQERAGFFAAVLLSLVVILLNISNHSGKSRWLVVVLLLFVGLAFLPMGLDALLSGDLRYSKGFDIGEERGYLSRMGWDFFLSHPFGAFYEFLEEGYRYPHNVFVSMFLVGGVFGGIAILILFFRQLIIITKQLLLCRQTRHLTFAAFWGLMFVAYTICSLTHNASIVFGTFDFFIFWGAFEALRDNRVNLVGIGKSRQ